MKDLSPNHTRSLLDGCPVALLLINGGGQIQGFNQAFRTLVGEAASTLDGDVQANGLIAPLLDSEPLVNWIMPDGDERWLRVDIIEIDATPALTARFYHDVTEKQRLIQERNQLRDALAKQALHDEQLPGLLSRLGLEVSLQPLASRSRRYETPLSIVGIGIDSREDREAIIKKASFLLKDQTRWADLVGCNQQHDFILILQETTQDAAMQLVEKLRTKLAAMDIGNSGIARASFGVTQCQRDDDADSMLERIEVAIKDARAADSNTTVTR